MEPQLFMPAPPYGQVMHPGGWGPPPYQGAPWPGAMLPPAGRGGNYARGPRGGWRGGGRGNAFNFKASAKRQNHGGYKNNKKRRKSTWQQTYATAAHASPAVAADTIQSERRHDLEAEQLLEQPCFNTWGTNHPTQGGPEEELVDAPWSVRIPAEPQEDAQPASNTPSPGVDGPAAPASSTSPPQQQLQEAQVLLQEQGSKIAELQQANQELVQALQQAEARSEQLEKEMLQLRSQLAATGSVQEPQLSEHGEGQAAA